MRPRDAAQQNSHSQHVPGCRRGRDYLPADSRLLLPSRDPRPNGTGIRQPRACPPRPTAGGRVSLEGLTCAQNLLLGEIGWFWGKASLWRYKHERRDDERTCTSGQKASLPSIDLGCLAHFLLARFASFGDEPVTSARNLAACSGFAPAAPSASKRAPAAQRPAPPANRAPAQNSAQGRPNMASNTTHGPNAAHGAPAGSNGAGGANGVRGMNNPRGPNTAAGTNAAHGANNARGANA